MLKSQKCYGQAVFILVYFSLSHFYSI